MSRAIEVQVEQRRLKLANLDKVFYPSCLFTKGQVIDYYTRIAPAILPHLRDRPVTLKRYPDGVMGQSFYEKRCPAHRPAWVATAAVTHGHAGEVRYCLLEDLPALVWAQNLAAIELHVQLARRQDIARPTVMVFDLDPGPPAALGECIDVALEMRELLEGLGLKSLPKTSGGKGLHVYVPLNTPVTYEQTKGFANAVARLFEKHRPDRVVSRMAKPLRRGKVLIDWSQNDPHKTTVCAYSLRAREYPTVSTPVTWAELQRARARGKLEVLQFQAADVLRRVADKGDLFADVLTLEQALPDGLKPGRRPAAPRAPAKRSAKGEAARRPGKRSAKSDAALTAYRAKRDFARSAEPRGARRRGRAAEGAAFVIQKHRARSLHFDFRLEVRGVLKSWAVPKGPSLNPAHKRLAMPTEDHPLEYAGFEGVIPPGQYGAGEVIVWDTGRCRNLSDRPMHESIQAGHVKVWLDGRRLRGGWSLVRSGQDRYGRDRWLMIKLKDEYAAADHEPAQEDQTSVLTGRSLDDLAAGQPR